MVRISGPEAARSLESLVGRLPEPRRAVLATLRDVGGAILDEALVLWFPGPQTATGEDLAEFHCHGGRAVVNAVQNALIARPGVRAAEAGEFTRRAFANGRIDLAEAEGLGDLLAAETDLQRSAALVNAQGGLSSQVAEWRDTLLKLGALVEATLDFSDEDDVAQLPESFTWNIRELGQSLGRWLDRPRSEKLGEGFRVALAGPPNAGKSTLFNALIESEAAITSEIAGTTRDALERNVAIEGVPFSFIDTAGLREESHDTIEQIGIERAHLEFAKSDVVLWLGKEGDGPAGAWEIAAKADVEGFTPKVGAHLTISARTGEGVNELKAELVAAAREALPKPGEVSLNARQHQRLSEAHAALVSILNISDPLLIGEELRTARLSFDRLIGKATTEDMLDTLFGRFCIGK